MKIKGYANMINETQVKRNSLLLSLFIVIDWVQF